MSNVNDYLCAPGLMLGVHRVKHIKIQQQRLGGGIQLKLVLERDGQEPLEITAFGCGVETPTWEYVGTWKVE